MRLDKVLSRYTVQRGAHESGCVVLDLLHLYQISDVNTQNTTLPVELTHWCA